MPASTTTSDEQTNRPETDTDPGIDISLLKEIGRKALIDSLNAVNGAKTLVLDPSIAGPLGLVTDVSLLKHHGVDKMFWLEPGPLSSTTTNIVYLCRPFIKCIKIVADHIKRHASESQKHIYHLILVPRVSTLVNRILEEEGVLGEVTISSYNLQFIPLADDVLSLENGSAFKEIWVDGDETCVYDASQALITIQKLFGSFPRIIGKGDSASRLAQLLNRQPFPASEDPSVPSDRFDSLIILDRKVDMITPLLTQLTYEGLIDELVGIKNSYVELPVSMLSTPAAPGAGPSTPAPVPATTLTKEKTKKHHLTVATDPLYGELQDLNFSAVGKKLNKVAHRLDEDYKLRHQAKTVAQLRDFVGKLGGLQTEHQSLGLHTRLSEMLVPLTRTTEFNRSLEIQQNLLASYDVSGQINAIEDMIAQGADMQVVVRLLSLASITTGGIKTKVLENIKREFLQTYGYHYLPLLLSLATPPLAILIQNPLPSTISPTESAASHYPFVPLRKSLRLLIDDAEYPDEMENDISYVYSGYAPISIRLIQCVAQKGGVLSNPALDKEKRATDDSGLKRGKSTSTRFQAHPIVGWKGFEDVLSSIPGETFDITPKAPGDSVGMSLTSNNSHESTRTTAVFFLGGCTYTEIAALRWVSRQNRGRRFLIATTGIISGRSLVEGVAGVSQKGPTEPSI